MIGPSPYLHLLRREFNKERVSDRRSEVGSCGFESRAALILKLGATRSLPYISPYEQNFLQK
jgi:hypothetical protein